eukprot:scaffold6180_cov200-Pinguiococcus_pyrenoidosus.AAC.13
MQSSGDKTSSTLVRSRAHPGRLSKLWGSRRPPARRSQSLPPHREAAPPSGGPDLQMRSDLHLRSPRLRCPRMPVAQDLWNSWSANGTDKERRSEEREATRPATLQVAYLRSSASESPSVGGIVRQTYCSACVKSFILIGGRNISESRHYGIATQPKQTDLSDSGRTGRTR